MKVTLKPISHLDMGEITIEETLFHVGRREEPFASMTAGAVAKLSRRHARIFLEDNDYYIVDLASLNGTQVNNQRLEKAAVPLRNGDEINLGGSLSFRVEIESGSDDDLTVVSLPSTQLVLAPADPESDVEPIVVAQFPFLVTRSDNVFGRYKDRYPDDVNLISRRHAVLSLSGDDVYIEDLQSANGTLVSGEKLDEHTRLLADGDVVIFGAERFRYTVHLDKPNQVGVTTGTVLTSSPPTGSTRTDSTQTPVDLDLDNPRTTFVSSPASFLDIFCDQGGENGNDGADAEGGQNAPKHGSTTGAPRKRGTVGELWYALKGESAAGKKPLWIGVSFVALLLCVGIGVYLVGQDRREVKALLDAGAYRESAELANQYLARHSDDREAGAWAQRALIKATLPGWIERIDTGQFTDAQKHLTAMRQMSPNIPDAMDLLDLLSWATRVEAHIAERGGTNTPIEIFRHEVEIKTLVESWNTSPARYQQLLTQISTYEPSFESVYTRVLSDLRQLRNENSLFGRAISNLKATVERLLRSNQHEKLLPAIEDFARKYPRVTGLGTLSDDARNYAALVHHIEQGELTQVVRLSRETEFLTPLFREKVSGWLDQALPPQDIIARYEEAASAWQAGKHEPSIQILEQLTSGPWGKVATRRIERQKNILANFQILQNANEQKDRGQRLLAFWSSLKQPEDDYFLKALKSEFRAHKDQVLTQLGQLSKQTKGEWNAYRNAGGIPAVIRVEERISKRFMTQAKRLSDAYATAREGAETYRLIQETPPADWQQLRSNIRNEVKRQRRSLEDLHLVLEPNLLKTKLDLLPELQEQSQ